MTEEATTLASDPIEAGSCNDAPIRVTLDDRLLQHLQKKGCHAILMDVAECKSCGGAVGTLFARAAKDAEAGQYLEADEGQALPRPKAPARMIPCLDGQGVPALSGGQPVQLIVARRAIKLQPAVNLRFKRVLGIADIAIEGAEF